MIRIYEETGSTTALSLFLLVYTAPSVFLGLFAGAFIDFWSKRKVILWTNLAQALVVLLYLGVKGGMIWPLYSIVFLYSLCDEFFGPALAANLPSLVKKESLPLANSLFLFTTQASIIVGSVLGGPLVKYLGNQAPFFLSSFFLFLAAAAGFSLPRDQPKRIGRETFESQIQALAKDIVAGYHFIKSRPRVFYPFCFYALSQMTIIVSLVLFPSLAGQLLKVDVRDAGLMVLLPVGLGGILGTVYLTRKIKSWGRKKLISVGWLLSGFCFLFMSLVIPQINFARSAAFLILFLLGLGGILVINTSLTMIQENTPEEIRGRVFGALSALMIISSYLPVFFLATITDFFGVVTTLFLIGTIIFLIGVISFKIDRAYVLRTRHRS
jgi:predicted MFS family arabinose efflux permease